MAGPRRSPSDRLQQTLEQLCNRVENAIDRTQRKVLLLFLFTAPVIAAFHILNDRVANTLFPAVDVFSENMPNTLLPAVEALNQAILLAADIWFSTALSVSQSFFVLLENGVPAPSSMMILELLVLGIAITAATAFALLVPEHRWGAPLVLQAILHVWKQAKQHA
jgi:hypothetical protein